MHQKSFRKYIFAFCIAILLLWFPDLSFNDNSLSRALPVLSFCEDGNLYFDKYEKLTGDKSFINGHFYSEKAPLPVFIVIPFAKALQLAGFFSDNPEENIKLILTLGGFLTSALPLFILMLWLFNSLDRNSFSNKNYWLSTLPFLSAFLWVYSASFYSPILAGFLLIICYKFLSERKLLLSGLFAGLAFLTEYPVIIIPATWLLQFIFREKKLKHFTAFAIGFLPAAILLLFYNYSISGNAFSLGYDYVDAAYATSNYGFRYPTFEAIFGLTFSPFRGVFIYAPVLIPIMFFAYKRFIKNASDKRFFMHAWIMPFIIYIIFISGFQMWWGGWSFGPRHLIPIVLFILFHEARNGNISKYFKAFLVFGLVGFTVVFLAKLTVMYNLPSAEKNPLINLVLAQAWEGEFNNSQSILTLLFGVPALISGLTWVLAYFIPGLFFSFAKQKT